MYVCVYVEIQESRLLFNYHPRFQIWGKDYARPELAGCALAEPFKRRKKMSTAKVFTYYVYTNSQCASFFQNSVCVCLCLCVKPEPLMHARTHTHTSTRKPASDCVYTNYKHAAHLIHTAYTESAARQRTRWTSTRWCSRASAPWPHTSTATAGYVGTLFSILSPDESGSDGVAVPCAQTSGHA
jgi:hypothetical protein